LHATHLFYPLFTDYVISNKSKNLISTGNHEYSVHGVGAHYPLTGRVRSYVNVFNVSGWRVQWDFFSTGDIVQGDMAWVPKLA